VLNALLGFNLGLDFGSRSSYEDVSVVVTVDDILPTYPLRPRDQILLQ
jgi:hypothetical protein